MKPVTPPRPESTRSSSGKLTLKNDDRSSSGYSQNTHLSLASQNTVDITLNLDNLQRLNAVLGTSAATAPMTENSPEMYNVRAMAARRTELAEMGAASDGSNARKPVRQLTKHVETTTSNLNSGNVAAQTAATASQKRSPALDVRDVDVGISGSPKPLQKKVFAPNDSRGTSPIPSPKPTVAPKKWQPTSSGSFTMKNDERHSTVDVTGRSETSVANDSKAAFTNNNNDDNSQATVAVSAEATGSIVSNKPPRKESTSTAPDGKLKSRSNSPAPVLKLRQPVPTKKAFTTEDPDLFEKRSSHSEFVGIADAALSNQERGRDCSVEPIDSRLAEIKAKKRRSRSVTNLHFDNDSSDLRPFLKKPPNPASKPHFSMLPEVTSPNLPLSPSRAPSKTQPSLHGKSLLPPDSVDIFASSDDEAVSSLDVGPKHAATSSLVAQRKLQMQQRPAPPAKQKSPSPAPAVPSSRSLQPVRSGVTPPRPDPTAASAALTDGRLEQDQTVHASRTTKDSDATDEATITPQPAEQHTPSAGNTSANELSSDVTLANKAPPKPPPKPARMSAAISDSAAAAAVAGIVTSDDTAATAAALLALAGPPPPPPPPIAPKPTLTSLGGVSQALTNPVPIHPLPKPEVGHSSNGSGGNRPPPLPARPKTSAEGLDGHIPLPPPRTLNTHSVSYDNTVRHLDVPFDNRNSDVGGLSLSSSPDDLDTFVQHPEMHDEPSHGRHSKYRNMGRPDVQQRTNNASQHESMVSTDLDMDVQRSDMEDDDGSSSSSDEDMGHKTVDLPVPEEEANDIPKHRKVAMELLSTERSYVKTLQLIDQVYYMEVINANRKTPMFPDGVCQQMFLNIKSIYLFHSGFLLEKLENVMKRWDEEGERVGETMKAFAPFLKMYVEYVNNFDSAINLIQQWTDKSKQFADLLLDIQRRPESGKLSLQHHMLAPIQRIPRYQLLLQEYIKRLPESSPDLVHAQKALDLVISANIHGNEAQKNVEKFKKLIEINENLGILDNLIGPTQTLIKEGRITKISARSGLPQERYIYLFSDVLLLCQPTLVQGKYKLKTRMDIEGMRVLEGNNLEIPDTFIVQSKQLSLELLASNYDEKMEWHETIVNVIRDYNKRMISRQPLDQQRFAGAAIGKMAPKWIHDHEASMCMKCGSTFTFFVRRHHCRGCGVVTCDRCTEKRAPLEYLGKVGRVCNDCYRVLTEEPQDSQQQLRASRASISSDTFTALGKSRKVLEVSGADPCVISGYMHWSADCKRWSRLWFAVHRDYALYCFKAHQDVKALNSIPLPSYKVDVLQRRDDNVEGSENIFSISHTKQTKYFKVDDRDQFNKWISALEKIVAAELPE